MIDNVRDALKIAKTMKRSNILITNNFMCGSDDDLATLSIILLESGINSFATNMRTAVDKRKDEKWINENSALFFSQYRLVGDDVYIDSWSENILKQQLLDMYKRILDHKSLPIFSITSIHDDAEFMSKVAKLKVSDGLSSYIINDSYYITSFNKVHSINSSDKVDLNIYDYDPVSYLYEFIINKKSHIVTEYIRYRKVLA